MGSVHTNGDSNKAMIWQSLCFRYGRPKPVESVITTACSLVCSIINTDRPSALVYCQMEKKIVLWPLPQLSSCCHGDVCCHVVIVVLLFFCSY